MFGMLKGVVMGVVKVIKIVKVVVGVAVAGIVLAVFLHLFGVGAVAGVAVSAATWTAERVSTALLASVAMLLDSAQVLGAATALLTGFLLLGLASAIMRAIEAIAEPVLLGYRAVRPVRPRAA